MHYTYVTHSKKEIGILMRALEEYIKTTKQREQIPKIQELYSKVRAAYYYENIGELYVRNAEQNIVKPKELTLTERIKFIVGGEK